jgi:putative DNA primase/helicase
VHDDGIPLELRDREQWLLWRREVVDGRPTKIPYRTASRSVKASTTDSSTWSSYDAAVAASTEEDIDGRGFVFSPDDPFCGVDVDGCIDEHGELHPAAAEIVKRLDSYTERSPGGRGLHIIIEAKLHGTRHRTGETEWGGSFEVYDSGRFFTMTGDGTRVLAVRQDELDELLTEVFPPGGARRASTNSGPRVKASADDSELLQKARNAKNGAKFGALYDAGEHSYPSDSEADLALCDLLAFWFVEPSRIDQAFRGSARMRLTWDETHGAGT